MKLFFKHNQHTYHRLPDGILFLWEQKLGIRYVLCQEAVTNYPPQLWPLCNWLVKMSRKFLQNTKVPHCWYFSDTRFIAYLFIVTLMGLLTIKNHSATMSYFRINKNYSLFWEKGFRLRLILETAWRCFPVWVLELLAVLCCAAEWSGECFDKISSDNKDYLLPQFAYKYNLVSWLCLARLRPRHRRGRGCCQHRQNVTECWS